MKKIEIIVGSTAKGLQYHLANSIKQLFADLADFRILTLNDLPFFNYQEEGTPASVVEFRNRIKEADGVVVLTAEYNGSIHAILKNAFDWASVEDLVFKHKPVFVTGASPSLLGSVKAQDHARYILNQNHLHANVLPGNHVLIGNATTKFDQEGMLVDEATVQFLRTSLENFMNWIDAH